ncbi:MAG: hypothetical protein WCR69_08535 [Sulfuricurvum sp.]|jgi:hypothetical protein
MEVVTLNDIAVDDFLPIFISSTLVLIFGGLYVGVYTAVKASVIRSIYMPLGYIFWVVCAYNMYLMGSLMKVNELTAKALIVAAIGLLMIPHAIYFMQDRVHEENEH